LIHDIPQLKSIYVFCGVNKSKYEEWSKNYVKIKGVFTEIGLICKALKQDVHQVNQDAIAISFISASDSPGNIQLDQLDASFMYTQLLKEIILEMNYNRTDFEEFVNYCRAVFDDNDYVLQEIDKFQRDYNSGLAIWWYTSSSFLYSMINKALRTFDIEIIMKMAFFIRDLHRQIHLLHVEQHISHPVGSFTIYRGQGMSKTDFDCLMKTKGGLLSFNNFLSTSRDRDVSCAFADSNQSNPDLVGILFTITIDSSISASPFASIRDFSYYQDSEDEVLFSMHTVFRIDCVQCMSENQRLFQVDLTLTSDNDLQLQMLTESIRHEIEGTGLQRLGALMLQIGEYDKAREVYEILLNAARPNEDRQGISSVHNQLGAIHSRQGDLEKALVHYNTSLELKLNYLSPNDSSLSPIYSNIGSVLRNQNQLNAALDYMERALNIELQASQSDPLKIGSYHNNIGLVLTDSNRYHEALPHYEQALKIQKKSLPPNHPDIATSYNNIGTIYNELQEYSTALSFYEKCVEVMQRSLPPNHPDLAIAYNNIGSLYNELQEDHRALSYYEKSLAIMQRSLTSNHPSLALGYHNLALTHYRLRSYKTALQYGERAIEICHHALEPNDPQAIAYQKTLDAIREKLEKDILQQ
jgi:tetratricopeptide (TPR) repeat protein